MRLALLLSLVVAAACAPAAPPTREPDTTGVITQVADGGRSVLVEERPQEQSGSTKTSVRVTGDTRIWRLTGVASSAARASAGDLAVGMTVRVWFDGPVAESYPGQARAADIAIDPGTLGNSLYVVSKGGPAVIVRVNGFEGARVACNGGAAIRPGADGTPQLPWQVVVTRAADGVVLLDERVTGLPRWLLVEPRSVAVGPSPVLGPFVPCP